MLRKIIRIDEEKCSGCGLCADACHENAIEIVNGKAKLIRENFCDGFGDCLPACPEDAIRIEEREAPAYDEAAVLIAKERKKAALCNWPVQLKLAPLAAPYFQNADLLVAADCTAFSYAAFHRDFMRGRVTLIGCPKLDAVDYTGKLTDILRNNEIRSITVLRMEVPCCGGLLRAVLNAVSASGRKLPLRTVTIGIDGTVSADEE